MVQPPGGRYLKKEIKEPLKVVGLIHDKWN
jgi:hypothetical protein